MNIIEAIKNLAAKEREVRRLEMLIEQVTSLKEEELAKVLAALASTRRRLGDQTSSPSEPSSDAARDARETPQQPVSVKESRPGAVSSRFANRGV